MSPRSATVVARAPSAKPIAVAIVPSMPFAPRLACTDTSCRGRAYHSRSRTGIDDATISLVSLGNAARTDLATCGSVGRSWVANCAAMVDSATWSTTRH